MTTNRALRAFYAVVLITALAGSTGAAAGWLGVDWWIAAAPVAAVELGGVVLSMFADDRRQLGESAIVARALSAAVALMAVAVNVFGHHHVGQAAFFGGMSGLGYAVYLLISAAKRRDALRTAGKLEDTAPAYGLWQWLRHPGITRRARILALTDAGLGKLTSLAAAREQVRVERREAAISTALRDLIGGAANPTMAQIAVHTYDLDEIAARLAAGADYDGLTALLAADLTPAALTGAGRPAEDLTALADTITPTEADRAVERMLSIQAEVEERLASIPETPPLPAVPATRAPRLRHLTDRRPRRLAAKAVPAVTVIVSPPETASGDSNSDTKTARKTPAKRQTTAERVAKAVARKPDISTDILATKLGVSERTVQRHMPPRPVAASGVNGRQP